MGLRVRTVRRRTRSSSACSLAPTILRFLVASHLPPAVVLYDRPRLCVPRRGLVLRGVVAAGGGVSVRRAVRRQSLCSRRRSCRRKSRIGRETRRPVRRDTRCRARVEGRRSQSNQDRFRRHLLICTRDAGTVPSLPDTRWGRIIRNPAMPGRPAVREGRSAPRMAGQAWQGLPRPMSRRRRVGLCPAFAGAPPLSVTARYELGTWTTRGVPGRSLRDGPLRFRSMHRRMHPAGLLGQVSSRSALPG